MALAELRAVVVPYIGEHGAALLRFAGEECRNPMVESEERRKKQK